MERVLIVAKTRMGDGVCVSGLKRSDNRGVRLIPRGHFNNPLDTKFEIGQVWDVEFRRASNVRYPHVEDVIFTKAQYISDVSNIRDILMSRIHPWEGEPTNLFEQKLIFNESKAYLLDQLDVPSCSAGYWLLHRELTLVRDLDKLFYHTICFAPIRKKLAIRYVGFAQPIATILPGTLVRVSLARWWAPRGVNEERCYLQISGWY